MKKIMQFALPVFMLLAIAQNTVTAQRSDTDRYFDESQGFTHRLWYGGGLAWGFLAPMGKVHSLWGLLRSLVIRSLITFL